MKKLAMIIVLLMALTGISYGADTVIAAVEPSIISGLAFDGFMLYDLNAKVFQLAPGLTYPIFSVLDGSFVASVGVAAASTNTENSNPKAGPIMTVSISKLASKVSGITWLSPKGLDIGAGVLVDTVKMFNQNNTVKDLLFPSVYLKIYTF
jgi:hypothetical protein